MSEAQQPWCTKMRRIFRGMTAAVAQLSGISLPHPSLHAQIPLMIRLHPIFVDTFDSSDDSLAGEPASKSDTAVFIIDFTALLSTLVPQLDRLGSRLSSETASSIGTLEEGLFWMLWQHLTIASRVFGTASYSLSEFWIAEPQPFHAPLYSAFDVLLTWLLSITRSPAWMLMALKHGKQGRNWELLLILDQARDCLFVLSQFVGPHLFSHLHMLPIDYIPKLCCIISEQFGNISTLVSQDAASAARAATAGKASSYLKPLLNLRHFKDAVCSLHSLMGLLINKLVCVGSFTGSSGTLSFVTAPAVLQLLKLILIQPAIKPVTKDDKTDHSMVSLQQLLERTSTQKSPFSKGLQSALDEQCNKDMAGLPLHPNPFVDKQALETDRLLLHMLGKHMDCHAGWKPHCYKIQYQVLQNWLQACKLYALPPAKPALAMFESVIRLAKQCAFHTTLLMQKLQIKQPEMSSQPNLDPEIDLDVSRELRNLLLLSAIFQRSIFNNPPLQSFGG